MNTNVDRLYELLPVVYRMRDAEQDYPLRELLRVIAEQVNVVEADIAQLYENWFIETCDDWVVPYIGELIGYAPLHDAGEPGDAALDPSRQRDKILSPRRDVAHVIRNRRRRGTLPLLELLADDVAGWPARAVQFYELLGVTQHLNHLHLERGRTLDVRRPEEMERLDGAFDGVAHHVDVRRINSSRTQGRTNIPSVGLFVWRLRPYSVTQAPAFCVDSSENRYAFSLLSNDAPLFTRPVPEVEATHIAEEANVPGPIRRAAFDRRKDDYYGDGKSLMIWRDDFAHPVAAEHIVPADLSHWAAYTPEGDQVAVDVQRGRIVFAKRTAPKNGVWVSYYYGFSADVGGGEYERVLRHSATAKPYRVGQNKVEATYQSLMDAIRHWQSDKPQDAVIEIVDSGEYLIVDRDEYGESRRIVLEANQRLELRAAQGARPVVRVRNLQGNRLDALRIEAAPRATPQGTKPEQAPNQRPGSKPQQQNGEAASEAPHGCGARIILDGLLVDGRGVRVEGEVQAVTIRHCTLVPHWSFEEPTQSEEETKYSLKLVNSPARVRIEHSILGAIGVLQNDARAEPNRFLISDSIVDAGGSHTQAMGGEPGCAAPALLTMLRSTVFGVVCVHAVELAENSIFIGRLDVARRQHGCVRFCYVTPVSRTPRRYECQPDLVEAAVAAQLAPQLAPGDERINALQRERQRVHPRFNSTHYGTPDYCQLAESCAAEIRQGADDEAEMGVFHDLFQPQREANLRARLEEFSPADREAGLIFVT